MRLILYSLPYLYILALSYVPYHTVYTGTTIPVYTGALIVRVHVCALPSALTAPTTGHLGLVKIFPR